jgi:hypothetical protein
VHKWERELAQYNLSLPYPEGHQGRYVCFTHIRLRTFMDVAAYCGPMSLKSDPKHIVVDLPSLWSTPA